jgi:uncharacterized protein (DUF58 family)
MKSNCIFRQKGRSHVLRIIRELIEFQPKSRKTDIAQALKFYRNSKKKAIVFVISDFMSEDYEQTLKIASKNTTSPAYASTIFAKKKCQI